MLSLRRDSDPSLPHIGDAKDRFGVAAALDDADQLRQGLLPLADDDVVERSERLLGLRRGVGASGHKDRLNVGSGGCYLPVDLLGLGRGEAVEHDTLPGPVGEPRPLDQGQKGSDAVAVLLVPAKPDPRRASVEGSLLRIHRPGPDPLAIRLYPLHPLRRRGARSRTGSRPQAPCRSALAPGSPEGRGRRGS